jgi:hypothetical protein
MAGLTSGALAQKPGGMDITTADPMGAKPGMAPAGGEGDGETPNVDPQEQEQYDQFVGNASLIIYPEGKMSPKVKEALAAGEDAKMALAGTTVTIVRELIKSAKDAGQEISSDVIFHGGLEILGMLGEAMEAAGLYEFKEGELEGAWYMALDLYREQGTQEGSIDPAALESDFGEVVAADREGRISEVLPGIETAPGANAGGEPAPMMEA